MRINLILAIVVTSIAGWHGIGSAANPQPQVPYRSPAYSEPAEFMDDGSCDCEACCARRAGLMARRNSAEGKDLNYNCGCQGSYKFPVPPLYTYHWPGMYSQRLMTDYHSPWRFPPIKPYTDEPKLHEAKPMPASARVSSRFRG